MDNLIRTDTVFGKRANIVGNISADLVLESLGKVYIKSRNKAQTIEELIQSLVVEDPNVSTSRVKVVEGIENLDTSEFKEGTFVFDKLSNILYLYIDNELLELINVAPEGTGYVRRSGDTMTGRLAIYVKNGPPLYVNSTTLVENLNAQYLNGETSESFTRRNRDENINGKWTFRRPITFESNSLFQKDIVLNGSIGSQSFAGGFGGYGWRMDADTNTLTIDNLVVRKLMQVYELVVNKISATNGSLWVSNAGKVTKVEKLEIKFSNFFSDTKEYKDFRLGLKKGEHFIKIPNSVTNKSFADTLGAFSNASGNNPRIKECWDESTLGSALVIGVTGPSDDYFEDPESTSYHTYKLFSEDFRFNCVFPIVTRSNYKRYKDDKVLAEATNSNLPEVFNYVSLIYSYYKYFANGDYYLVSFDNDSLPVFKPGDILRCQKWTYGGIKYYDAVVCNYLESKYIIQLAPSFYDQKTIITYNTSLDAEITYQEDKNNLTLYKQTANYRQPSEDSSKNVNIDEQGNAYNLSYEDQLKKNLEGVVEEKDSLVQMGHLWDSQRQNAVYITSTDNGAPYLDVISGVNRPDYSVIYYVPIYKTIKLNVSNYTNIFTGYEGLVNIPYTGDYYVQEEVSFEYILFEYNGQQYLSTNKNLPQVLGGTVKLLYYLSTAPNAHTQIGDSTEFYNILSEDGKALITEEEDKYIVQENQKSILQVASTRTTKARFGNLEGIQDEIFPINRQPYGYGLYAQNVFLTGEFYLNNGRSLAEIGTDAIQFALASANSIYDSIQILKEDTERADNLLKQSIYTRGELRSAGMRIGKDSQDNPGIVMWGNKILMATTAAEFDGKVEPTVLFANGRIASKFISVNNIHSVLGFGQPNDVFQKEYIHTDGSKYYKEELVLSEEVIETEGEDPVIKYYYINSQTGNKEYLTGQEPILPGNTLYGWNLEATGEGYLAQGNILWDDRGSLIISGDINVKGSDYGIHIFNDNGLNTLNITGRNITEKNTTPLNQWASTNNRVTINLYTPYTVLQTVQVSEFYDYRGDLKSSTVNLQVIKNISVTQQGGIFYVYPNCYVNFPIRPGTRPPVNSVYLYIILSFLDSTQEVHQLPYIGDVQYSLGQKVLTNMNICVQESTVQYELTSSQGSVGYLRYSSINVISEFGANFLGLISDNNMFWFGENGLRIGAIKDSEKARSPRYSGAGLAVDSRGVLINNIIRRDGNLSDLARDLDIDESSLDSTLVDALYGIDGTFDCIYYSDTRNEGSYLIFDANSYNNTYGGTTSSTYDGLTYLQFHISPGPGLKKVNIIKPSNEHPLRVSILDFARIGKIIILQLDVVSSGSANDYMPVRVAVAGGAICRYDQLAANGEDSFIMENAQSYDNYGLQLQNEPLILMYLGQKTFNGFRGPVWKSLTPKY